MSRCGHCGERSVAQLMITKRDPDLDGLDIGLPETRAIAQDTDTKHYQVIEDYCSEECIHQAGEMAHAEAEDHE